MNASKSGIALLRAAINASVADQGFTFLDEDLNIGIVELTPAGEYEVAVSVDCGEGGIYKTVNGVPSRITGFQSVVYNRLDLGGLFLDAGIETVVVPVGEYATVGEVVDFLNSEFDLGFGANDFDFDAPVDFSEGLVELTVAESSYGFTGTLYLRQAEVPLQELALNEVIIDPVLELNSENLVQAVSPQ